MVGLLLESETSLSRLWPYPLKLQVSKIDCTQYIHIILKVFDLRCIASKFAKALPPSPAFTDDDDDDDDDDGEREKEYEHWQGAAYEEASYAAEEYWETLPLTRSHIDTTKTISGNQEEEEAEEVEELEMELQEEVEEAVHLYKHNYQEDNKLSRHI